MSSQRSAYHHTGGASISGDSSTDLTSCLRLRQRRMHEPHQARLARPVESGAPRPRRTSKVPCSRLRDLYAQLLLVIPCSVSSSGMTAKVVTVDCIVDTDEVDTIWDLERAEMAPSAHQVSRHRRDAVLPPCHQRRGPEERQTWWSEVQVASNCTCKPTHFQITE